MNGEKRDFWIDNVKAFACILVVLGHFFQSMVKSQIVSYSNLYEWFNTTIYYFHVPLFFICSGYLYQKYCVIGWRKNILKKVLTLGVPYITFTIITWILKTLFTDSINNQIGPLWCTLLLNPTSPYWYLYCLFLCFLVTPIFKNKIYMIIGVVASLGLKVMSLIGGGYRNICY